MPYSNEYRRERYKRLKAAGMCTVCAGPMEPERAGKTRCSYCEHKHTESILRRNRLKRLTNPAE